MRPLRRVRKTGAPDDTFIDLYVADVAVPTIGRSLLGDDGYDRLAGRLKPGQQALVVAGSGRYSFKGAAYVRGGIFDRIELIQETNSIRFRDRDHTRLGDLAAEGAPDFPKSRCSSCRRTSRSTRPSLGGCSSWCSASSAHGTRPWVTFDLGYTLARNLPQACRRRFGRAAAAAPASQSAPAAAPEAGVPTTDEDPLWMRIWRADTVKVATTIIALRGSHPHLLLPELPGPSANGLHVGPPRLSCCSSWSGSAGTRTRSFPSSTS